MNDEKIGNCLEDVEDATYLSIFDFDLSGIRFGLCLQGDKKRQIVVYHQGKQVKCLEVRKLKVVEKEQDCIFVVNENEGPKKDSFSHHLSIKG